MQGARGDRRLIVSEDARDLYRLTLRD